MKTPFFFLFFFCSFSVLFTILFLSQQALFIYCYLLAFFPDLMPASFQDFVPASFPDFLPASFQDSVLASVPDFLPDSCQDSCRHPFRTSNIILVCLSTPPVYPPALRFPPPLKFLGIITLSENRKENTIL